MRTRALAALVALALLMVGCSSHRGSRIEVPGNGSSGATIHQLRPGQDLFLQWPSLCTTGKPITITKVIPSPTHSAVIIADWGTHYIPPGETVDNEVGIGTGPISQVPGFGHHPVKAVCGKTSAMEFFVSLGLKADKGHINGATVYWHGGSTFVQYDVTYCKTAVLCHEQP